MTNKTIALGAHYGPILGSSYGDGGRYQAAANPACWHKMTFAVEGTLNLSRLDLSVSGYAQWR
ncbi:hypothetical protein BH11PSE6_BH11PSE6_05890 [soil metagenome]